VESGSLERSEGPPPSLEEAGLRGEEPRLTQEAGCPSCLGAQKQVVFWLLPEATESTCPHSDPQPLPRG